jgi:hypothetical protein
MFAGILILWLGFSVAVGLAANSRGRDGVGWFFVAALLSPLIAGLFVLALPSPASALGSKPFVPDGVFSGVPYRLRPDGLVEAILPGGPAVFPNRTQFEAAISGGTIEFKHVHPDYPNNLNGFSYRIVRHGIVALTPDGREMKFKSWKEFWAAAHIAHRA